MTHRRTIGTLLLSCWLVIACAPQPTAMPISTITSKPEVALTTLPAITPTQASLPPQIDNVITISPNGSYLITCEVSDLVLFDAKSSAIVSKFNLGYSFCPRNIYWSKDNLYAIVIDQDATLYQWPVDGSQPVELNTNINLPPSRFTGHTNIITAWSPDGNYLAIFKECSTYITQPFGGALLQNPLKVGEGCVIGIQWATNNVLMVDSWSEYLFYQVPTGTQIGHWSKREGCLEQVPSISPDQRWMVFQQCDLSTRFNQRERIDQYSLANLEQGSVDVFSATAGNYIDFIGWKEDGAAFYFISRSAFTDSSPDPRTPFGLLALNPATGEISNLFEQVWFATFNKDLSWAFVVFPATNPDGTLRLDGGLWQVGTSEIKGRQVMDSSEEIRLNGNRDVISYGVALWTPTDVLLSPTGEYLGASAAFNRLVPAAWSNDNTRIALINDDRQVVVMDLEGNTQVAGQLEGPPGSGIDGYVAWSHDDKLIIVEEKTFPVP